MPAGLGQASTSQGNQTDSTGNVSPVVILSSDGNTNYQGSKGSAINALYRRAPNDPGRLQRAVRRLLTNTRAVPAPPVLEPDHSTSN